MADISNAAGKKPKKAAEGKKAAEKPGKAEIAEKPVKAEIAEKPVKAEKAGRPAKDAKPVMSVIEGGLSKKPIASEAPGMAPVRSDGMTPDAAGGRSNERVDVARRILELSGTIAEAIDYLHAKIDLIHDGLDSCAGILKDIGEGLISLENAANAISGPLGTTQEDIQKLTLGYDELTGRMDEIISAYAEDRAMDAPALINMLRESFSAYDRCLTDCFRKMSIN